MENLTNLRVAGLMAIIVIYIVVTAPVFVFKAFFKKESNPIQEVA